MQPCNSGAPIMVERIVVQEDRLVCRVRIADARYRCSTAGLAQRVRSAFPDIVQHSCVNSEGAPFAQAMATTSVPHLLEHIAIDMQVHQCPELVASSSDVLAFDSDLFVGTTEWLNESEGLAEIQLSFADDLQALAAFKSAVEFLNTALCE